jgi:hypothetical protein
MFQNPSQYDTGLSQNYPGGQEYGNAGYDAPLPQYIPTQGGKIFSMSQQQQDFLKGIYSYDEAISRLVHYWRGDEKDENGDWVVNTDPVKSKMNATGIAWAKNVLMTFSGGQFIMTTYERWMVIKRVRGIAHSIRKELFARRIEFGFQHTLDISQTCLLMSFTIEAVFNGTLGDAHRNFMSKTTNQNLIETKDMSQRRGLGAYFGLGGGGQQQNG